MTNDLWGAAILVLINVSAMAYLAWSRAAILGRYVAADGQFRRVVAQLQADLGRVTTDRDALRRQHRAAAAELRADPYAKTRVWEHVKPGVVQWRP